MEHFNKLDDFLTKHLDIKSENNDKQNICCKDEKNIIETSEWFVCKNCGKIEPLTPDVTEYKDMNMNFINKTYICMSLKNYKIVRLHKWLNYSYYEVRNDKLIKFIDTLPIDKDTKSLSKILFLQEFKQIRTRAKVKMGLICYAIYKSYLSLNKNIDIDDLFKILDINQNQYNSAIKKIKSEKLHYPKNINHYITLFPSIDKNLLIRDYNLILDKNLRFNSKTILSSLIYKNLIDNNNLNNDTFFKKIKVSKNSINSVMKIIDNSSN